MLFRTVYSTGGWRKIPPPRKGAWHTTDKTHMKKKFDWVWRNEGCIPESHLKGSRTDGLSDGWTNRSFQNSCFSFALGCTPDFHRQKNISESRPRYSSHLINNKSNARKRMECRVCPHRKEMALYTPLCCRPSIFTTQRKNEQRPRLSLPSQQV